jgi:hypothetical protein
MIYFRYQNHIRNGEEVHRLLAVAAFSAPLLSAQTEAVGFPAFQDRWNYYIERTYSWQKVASSAAESVFEQTFRLDKCGRPPYCIPRNFGGAMIRRTTRTTIELGAGALLHEDLRRRPSGLTGVRRRISFALTHAALAQGSDGNWGPAYGRYAGTVGAVTVSAAWRGRPLTVGNLAASAGWSASNYFQDALFAEFEPDLRAFGQRKLRSLYRGLRPSLNLVHSRLPAFLH